MSSPHVVELYAAAKAAEECALAELPRVKQAESHEKEFSAAVEEASARLRDAEQAVQQHDATLRKERDRYKEMFEAAVADRRLFEAESLMLMEEWFQDRQTSRSSTEVRSNHAATHITASTQPCCHTHMQAHRHKADCCNHDCRSRHQRRPQRGTTASSSQ